MQVPVVLGDGLWIQNAILWLERGVALRIALLDEGGVDAAVDHHMGDVNVLCSEFACHALSHRTQAVLAGGKG